MTDTNITEDDLPDGWEPSDKRPSSTMGVCIRAFSHHDGCDVFIWRKKSMSSHPTEYITEIKKEEEGGECFEFDDPKIAESMALGLMSNHHRMSHKRIEVGLTKTELDTIIHSLSESRNYNLADSMEEIYREEFGDNGDE